MSNVRPIHPTLLGVLLAGASACANGDDVRASGGDSDTGSLAGSTGGVGSVSEGGSSAAADETGSPSGDIVYARMLLEPLVRAQCDNAFACCSAGELALQIGPSVTDADTCTERVLDLMESGVNVSYGPSSLYFGDFLPLLAYGIDQSATMVNEEGFQDCAGALSELGCAPSPTGGERCEPPPISDSNHLAACSTTSLFKGKRQLGEECKYYGGIECAEGLNCRFLGATGVCIDATGGEGDPCIADYQCGKGFTCDFEAGSCVAAGGPGDPCMYADPDNPLLGVESVGCTSSLVCNPVSETCEAASCNFGTYCSYDYQCPTGLECVAGRCDFKARAGEDCYNDDDCATGFCEYGAQGSHCRTLFGLEESCDAHRFCQSGYCHPETNSCAPALPPGSSCEPDLPSQQCYQGYCEGTTCVAYGAIGDECPPAVCDNTRAEYCYSGVCSPYPYVDGVSCSEDYSCASGNCQNNACAPRLTIGSECRLGSNQCDIQAYCAADGSSSSVGECAPRLGQGAECTTDTQCWSYCTVQFGALRCVGLEPGGSTCDGV